MGLQHRDIEISDRIDSCRSGSSVATGYPDTMCGSVKTLHKARRQRAWRRRVFAGDRNVATSVYDNSGEALLTKLVSQTFESSGAIQILRTGCQASKKGGRNRCTLQKTAAREFRHAQILLRRSYGAPSHMPTWLLSPLEGGGRSEHDT